MRRWIGLLILFVIFFELLEPSSNFIRIHQPAQQSSSQTATNDWPLSFESGPVHACEPATEFVFLKSSTAKDCLHETLVADAPDGISFSIFHPPKTISSIC